VQEPFVKLKCFDMQVLNKGVRDVTPKFLIDWRAEEEELINVLTSSDELGDFLNVVIVQSIIDVISAEAVRTAKQFLSQRHDA
jgi:hypothetical protein